MVKIVNNFLLHKLEKQQVTPSKKKIIMTSNPNKNQGM